MALLSREEALEIFRFIWDATGKLVENLDWTAMSKEAPVEKRIQIQNLADRLKKDLTELGEIWEEFGE
ncbi:MAG: hypothetical protein V1770_06050 [bacterium]